MKRHATPTFFKGAQSVRTSEYWQMAVVFESQPPFYKREQVERRCKAPSNALGRQRSAFACEGFDSLPPFYLVSLTIYSLHL